MEHFSSITSKNHLSEHLILCFNLHYIYMIPSYSKLIFQLQSVYKIMDTFLELTDDVKDKYRMNPPEQIQGYISLGMEQ